MSEIFEEADALEKTAGDRELLAEVIRFTLNDMPEILNSLARALSVGEWADASRLAHKAKGSAGACGARELYLSALNLEHSARDGDVSCVSNLPHLNAAFENFRKHPAVQQIASLDPHGAASIG